MDIVERLRARKATWQEAILAMELAAAEIERLRHQLHHYPMLETSFHAANKLIEQHEAENERLRAALTKIAHSTEGYRTHLEIARQAIALEREGQGNG